MWSVLGYICIIYLNVYDTIYVLGMYIQDHTSMNVCPPATFIDPWTFILPAMQPEGQTWFEDGCPGRSCSYKWWRPCLETPHPLPRSCEAAKLGRLGWETKIWGTSGSHDFPKWSSRFNIVTHQQTAKIPQEKMCNTTDNPKFRFSPWPPWPPWPSVYPQTFGPPKSWSPQFASSPHHWRSRRRPGK